MAGYRMQQGSLEQNALIAERTRVGLPNVFWPLYGFAFAR